MTKRICWKKGMRLTDEILKSSDKCHLESLKQVFVLASNSRFGLLPSNREFNISLSVNRNIVDVEALDCLAITKSGNIIDINYDTSYTNNLDTRLTIPSNGGESYILCVGTKDSWKETYDGFCEPEYKFTLIQEDCMLGADMFPIARIINEVCWRLDEENFIPPCLFISSHSKYNDQLRKFDNILKQSKKQLLDNFNSYSKTAISIFWPIVEQLKITIDKEIDLMTPMMLLGNIQKYISGYVCACMVGQTNSLDLNTFMQYVNTPYNYKDIFIRIKEGLDLCNDIVMKFSVFTETVNKETEVKVYAPTISDDHLLIICSNNDISIPVNVNNVGATVHYTIDGNEPTKSSMFGNCVKFISDFKEKGQEEDKYYTIKVKAFIGEKYSETNTYKIRLKKNLAAWTGIWKI